MRKRRFREESSQVHMASKGQGGIRPRPCGSRGKHLISRQHQRAKLVSFCSPLHSWDLYWASYGIRAQEICVERKKEGRERGGGQRRKMCHQPHHGLPVGKVGLGPTEESPPHLRATETLEIELSKALSLFWRHASILISRRPCVRMPQVSPGTPQRGQGSSLLTKGGSIAGSHPAPGPREGQRRNPHL